MLTQAADLEFTRTLLALTLVLLTAHVGGFIFQRCSMPRVIGEIAAGVLLGPTVFGRFFPSGFHWVFSGFEGEGKLIGLVAWFGLIFIMFISGFEIDKRVERSDWPLVFSILVCGTIVPFLCGWGAAQVWDFSPYMGPHANPLALRLIIAVAVAITSIPVVSRIFLDLDIIQTQFARIVLTTATVHDLILWVALSIAAMLAGGQTVSLAKAGQDSMVTIVFFLACLFILPALFERLTKARYNWLMRSSAMGFILFICFTFVVFSSLLQINVVFGAFLAGIVVGRMRTELFIEQKQHIKEMAMGLFVPFYFAMVGVKLDLINGFSPLFCLGFIIFATVVSMSATLLGAGLVQKNWLANLNLAFAMNARGGPGIVVASLAYDWGIINAAFFSALIILALVTSLMAGWWLKFVLNKRWPLLT